MVQEEGAGNIQVQRWKKENDLGVYTQETGGG